MRTTLTLDDDLVRQAMEATGVQEVTALVHLGLRLLVEKATRERLIRMGGENLRAKASPRRRANSR